MLTMPLKTNPLSGEAPAGRVYAGRGISIAILDTGISPTEDFILPENRIVAFRDLVNGKRRPYDDNGHGTHVTCFLAKHFSPYGRQSFPILHYRKKARTSVRAFPQG